MAESRDARLLTKRTSVPGKIPTGTTGNEGNLIKSGELASNLADRKLFGYDGTDVFEYGTNSFLNLTGGTISGNLEVVGNMSASTYFSGGTNLETIISNLSSGEINTASNVGGGVEVFKTKSGTDLQFRTFSAGTNVGLSQVGDVITISASTAGGGSIQFSWTFKTVTGASDPGSGNFRLNATEFSAATELYISDTTVNGVDIGTLIELLEVGDAVYVQQKNDSSKGAFYVVSGTVVDNSGWHTISINYNSDAGGGIPVNNRDCAFIFYTASSGDVFVNSASFGVAANDTLRLGLNNGNNVDVVVNEFTTLTASTYFSGGTNLYDIFSTNDTFVTGATFDGTILTLENNDGSTVDATITGFTLSGITINVSEEDFLIDGKMVGDSSFKHWAEIYNDNNTTATTISSIGTPVKAALVSILGGAKGFSMPFDNRILYTATTSGQTFEATVAISGEASSGSQSAQFMLYKNGVTEITATISSTEWTSSQRALALTGTFEMSENDYIELWCQNNTSKKNLEVKTFTVRIAQI